MSSLVPKPTRDNVYRFLFTEGVLCCPKNRMVKCHLKLGGKKLDVPVNQMMHLMRQLKSKGLIRENFAFRHFYWFLNENGIEFLRKYLFLESHVVPNTHRRVEGENFERRAPRAEGEGGGRGRGRGRSDGEGGRGRGGRGFGRGRGGDGEGRDGGGRGFGRGRGGRGGGDDRSNYHADPNAGAGFGGNTDNADGPARPTGRGRGRGAAAPTQ